MEKKDRQSEEHCSSKARKLNEMLCRKRGTASEAHYMGGSVLCLCQGKTTSPVDGWMDGCGVGKMDDEEEIRGENKASDPPAAPT